MKKTEWWKQTFDQKYLDTYVDTLTPERTAADLRFIKRTLKLPKGSAILDLACGHGRITNPLAEAGYKMTGLDYSNHFLTIADEEGSHLKNRPTYVQGEMAKFELGKKFDAVISWFTSLGYYEDEKDNKRIFENTGRHLKKGGLFLIDMNNPLRPLRFLDGHKKGKDGKSYFTKIEKLSNGIIDKSTITFDLKTMRWKNEHEVKDGKKKYSYVTDARNYMYPELKAMIEDNGMEVIKSWGNTDGSAFAFDTRRMIILAKKK